MHMWMIPLTWLSENNGTLSSSQVNLLGNELAWNNAALFVHRRFFRFHTSLEGHGKSGFTFHTR